MTTALRTAATIVAAALVTQGCIVSIRDDGSSGGGRDWQAVQAHNRSVIPTLALGTPLTEVVQTLGEPDFTEAFTTGDGEFRALFFRTQHVEGDGRTTRDETTPLVFRDGVLHGIGDDYYRRIGGG